MVVQQVLDQLGVSTSAQGPELWEAKGPAIVP